MRRKTITLSVSTSSLIFCFVEFLCLSVLAGSAFASLIEKGREPSIETTKVIIYPAAKDGDTAAALPVYNNIYTVQVHPSITPAGLAQAEMELPYLLAHGLDCRVAKWDEPEGLPRFRILCGQSTTLTGLDDTVKKARAIFLDFVVVAAPYSKELPLVMRQAEKDQILSKAYEEEAKNVAAAFELLNSGEIDKAEAMFKDILTRAPGTINAHYGLVIAEIKRKNWKKAYELIDPLLRGTNRTDIAETGRTILFYKDLDLGWALAASAPDKALLAFNRALAVEDKPDAWKGLAHTYYNMGELDKSLAWFEKVYQKEPDVKVAEMILIILERLDRYDKAVTFYNSLPADMQATLTMNPTRKYTLSRIDKFLRLGKLDEAEELLRQLSAKDPDNLDVLLYYGWYFLEKKDPVQAEQYYRKALNQDATNVYALRGLGGALLAQQREEEALVYLEKLDPEQADVARDVDKAYLALYRHRNDYAKAVEVARRLVARDPVDPNGYLMLADIYLEMGDQKNAYYYYTRAEQIDPNNFSARIRILRFFLQKKRFDQVNLMLEAIRNQPLTTDQFEELRRFYNDYYVQYASYLLSGKEYRQALATAEHGLSLYPDDPGLMSMAAWSAYNLDEADKAVRYFQSALVKGVNKTDLWYGSALSYQKLGNKEKVLEMLEKAEDSENSDVLYSIADLYRQNGQPDKAERIAKKADTILTNR